MYNEKILPINTNVERYSECWTHMRLAFVLTKKECYPWYCENLNNYYIENKYFTVEFDNAFSASYFNIYKDILNEKTIILNKETKENIIDAISHDGYVIAFCNYQYLFSLDKDTKNHEILIYGYDNIKQLFFIYLHDNSKWRMVTADQQRLIESMNVAVRNQEEYLLRSIRFELPCIAYFFKKDISVSVNIRNIFMQLARYLDGGVYEYLNNHDGKRILEKKELEKHKIYIGNAAYDAYGEGITVRLEEKSDDIRDYLFRGIEHILGNKRQLENKINFIFQLYDYNHPLEGMDKIINEIIIFRNLLMKYYRNGNWNNVENAVDMLETIKYKDREYYLEILNCLQDIIEEEISCEK